MWEVFLFIEREKNVHSEVKAIRLIGSFIVLSKDSKTGLFYLILIKIIL